MTPGQITPENRAALVRMSCDIWGPWAVCKYPECNCSKNGGTALEIVDALIAAGAIDVNWKPETGKERGV